MSRRNLAALRADAPRRRRAVQQLRGAVDFGGRTVVLSRYRRLHFPRSDAEYWALLRSINPRDEMLVAFELRLTIPACFSLAGPLDAPWLDLARGKQCVLSVQRCHLQPLDWGDAEIVFTTENAA